MKKATIGIAVLGATLLFFLSFTGSSQVAGLTDIELLGKYVFFDKISNPPRMACVTCHNPATGGTGGVSGVNLHQVAITGANPHTVGNLKPPTNAYATEIAPLFKDCAFGVPGICGGNFWNGRAEGTEVSLFEGKATKHIGDEIFYETGGTLIDGLSGYSVYFGATADQALNPMPNPVEQNILRQGVCLHVASSKYAELYEQVWGVEIDCSDNVVSKHARDVNEEKAFDISFKRLMLAVCAWQKSTDLNSFSSKRDWALKNDNDSTPGRFPLAGFTRQENLGHDLFYGVKSDLNPEGKSAGCAACHTDKPFIPFPPPGIPGDTGDELFQLYADDGYHNIGTPRNPEIPVTFDGDGNPIDPDLGLKGLTGLEQHRGFHKTPTLRNVDKRPGKGFTKAYTHNGWFKSLESIVHFYNTAWFGGVAFIPGQGLVNIPYEKTTAADFGLTQCPEGIETEKDALANNCWPVPAVSGNGPGSPAFPALLGNLHLTAEEEAAIVAYMKTFTDEHTAKAPKPYKSNKR